MTIKVFQIFISFTLVFCLDSDGDGYTDKAEKLAGTNPEDFNSSIYQGFWPFNIQKESIFNPGFGICPNANGCKCDIENMCPEDSECTQLNMGMYCVPKVGSRVPRFKGTDQFGDTFDLYDLANQGKPILIEIGTTWPQACRDFSAWRSYVNDDVRKNKWWKEEYEEIRNIIDNQDIYWVHIIHLDESRNPSNPETVSSWHESYPHDNIIVLADPEAKMKTWVRPTGYPCLILIDENMNLQIHTLRGIGDAINEVYNILDLN